MCGAHLGGASVRRCVRPRSLQLPNLRNLAPLSCTDCDRPAGAQAVLAARHFLPAVKRSLSVSSTTALIVSPVFAAFFFVSEQTMVACTRRGRV